MTAWEFYTRWACIPPYKPSLISEHGSGTWMRKGDWDVVWWTVPLVSVTLRQSPRDPWAFAASSTPDTLPSLENLRATPFHPFRLATPRRLLAFPLDQRVERGAFPAS
jgi:hypothetical protein